jgi:penicillin amidase
MVTATTSLSTPQTQSRLRRPLAVAGLVLTLASVGVLAYLYWVARSALPRLDGQLIVQGLSAPVTVIRDQHGVPTIEAANLPDLFFAQGYVTAQDRLWQMDLLRRFAAGELAEIFGESVVEQDRQQRILGLRTVAARSVQLAPARNRVFFEAYAHGINAFIQAHADRLPIEFRILHYAPKPWTAEDSILMGVNMVVDLNHGVYRVALEREQLLAALGPELAADLAVNGSWHDRPPTQGPPRMGEPDNDDDSPAVAATRLGQLRPTWPLASSGVAEDHLVPGSNNWVVSGSHTVSGKPLLSNDMHLGHQMPNLWYEAHLRSGNFDVAGVTLPGLPFVIVGHNQRIGWGFTNVGPTVQDLYIETFNDRGQYLTPEGWRDPEHRVETIKVKGKPDVAVDVTVTRHGPVITELIPGEQRKLALHWTLYDGLHDPFFDVDAAQNWDEFVRALATWDSPAQNAVYADVDGHIGYHTTGHIPLRASGDGSLPVNGSDNAHEWTGYIPFDRLPAVFDPPWGVIATANGRITPDGYPYPVSDGWGAPWRTERIYHVLESGKKLAPADMLALQMDVYSAFDRFCAERFVYALDHVPKLSQRASQAREIMRDWDGRMTVEAVAPTIEVRARRALLELLIKPKLAAAQKTNAESSAMLSKDVWRLIPSVVLETILLKQPQRWLPPNYADYNAVLAVAVEQVVSGKEAPRNLAEWKWGKTSPVEIQHPVLGHLPLLNRWTGPGIVPQPGGSYTVKQSGRHFGPSERLTVDFSNLDQSTLNLVTGQGGNFLSPYYMDQWKAWYGGTTFTLPFSPAAVENTRAHRLELQPPLGAVP